MVPETEVCLCNIMFTCLLSWSSISKYLFIWICVINTVTYSVCEVSLLAFSQQLAIAMFILSVFISVYVK